MGQGKPKVLSSLNRGLLEYYFTPFSIAIGKKKQREEIERGRREREIKREREGEREKKERERDRQRDQEREKKEREERERGERERREKERINELTNERTGEFLSTPTRKKGEVNAF